MSPPLHAKRSYVWIQAVGQGQQLEFLAYTTGWRFNTSAENVSDAVFCGTDVTEQEIHGISGRANAEFILSTDEADFLSALANGPTKDPNEIVNYDLASSLVREQGSFTMTQKVNMVIAPLENALAGNDAEGIQETVTLETIRSKLGYVYELNEGVILNFEVSGNAGQWVRGLAEIKSGKFIIRKNEP